MAKMLKKYCFTQIIKTKFLKQLKNKVKEAMFVNDPIFPAFDIFSINGSFDENKMVEKVSILAKFYGNGQMYTFEESTNLVEILFKEILSPKMLLNFSLKISDHSCK